MIKRLKIERFKSIKSLELECRRINLFIGEPNVGKSNILESLGLLSWSESSGKKIAEFVRFQLIQQLFYDSLTDAPVQVSFKGDHDANVNIKFEQDRFVVYSSGAQDERMLARLSYQGDGPLMHKLICEEIIQFYRFRFLEKFDSSDPSALMPPDGKNLFSVVYGSKAMREWMTDLYRPYGLSCVLKPHEKTFELQKNQDGVVTAFSYSLSSDTLQRMLFYHAAIASNKNAVLVFEEPEAHAFPYYTKHLGESIALGESNQYFIATHNPYLLTAIVEKAPQTDVAVYATYYKDFETHAKLLTNEELGRLMEADPFLGLELILGSEVSA